MKFETRTIAILTIAALLSGCSTKRVAPEQIDRYVEQTLDAARRQQQGSNDVEAFQLVETLLQLDPENPAALEIQDQLTASTQYLFAHPLLGSNFAHRPTVERSTAAKLALYLPDRLLDLCDVVSFDLHLGVGAYIAAHATRAAQLGGGVRGTAGIGWHDRRSLGGLAQGESSFSAANVGAQALAAAQAGTSGVFVAPQTFAGIHRPSDPLYQQFRDYWAVGGAVTGAGLGFDFDIHPVEIADWIAGIAGTDLLNDDFAHTRGLRLTRTDNALLRRIFIVLRSRETMSAYAEYLRANRSR